MSGHLADINDLAFSPDGALLVTASADGTARLWQAASGRLVASLEAHGDAVMSAVFSPDGTHVLTGSWDGTARVWDRSGTPLGVLVGHSSLVYRAIYDPRGERIATVGIDGSARIWSGTLRSTVRYLVGHQAPVKSASFSADGRRLLSVASDHTARVWQVATGRELERLAVGDDVSWGLFLPGDRLGWVVDRRVRVADAGGEDTGRFFDADSAILWAETSRRGDHLLTISVDRRAIVWDLASARRLAAFPAVWARLAQDGRTVIAIGVDGQVEVWDGPTGVRRRVIRAHRGPSWYALPCEGGRRILSMGADGTLRHWETATGALLRSVSLKVNYVGFEATDDCHFVAAMGDRHLVSLLDAASGQALDFVDARSSESVLITMDPPGTRVAAVDGDRIGVWDIELASESPDEIAAWTRCAVPFRVVGSELVAASIEEARCASR
jgi:WD40 repeat protein